MKIFYVISFILFLFVIVFGINKLIIDNSNIEGIKISKLEKITVRLPIPIYDAAFTPFFVALDKGYYEEEGLDVKFELGSSELNPVKMVASGADTIGILGGPDTLLVARSKGQPVKAVAVLHRNSDFPGIITLKRSGITELKQLENKKVGFFYGHISTDVVRNMLHKANINVEEVDVGFNYAPLIAGQIDAQWAFRTTAGINLPEQGEEINFISSRDYGINTHGYTIFSTDDTLQNRKKMIEAFLVATFRGVKESIEKPEESLDSLLKQDKNLNKEVELKRLKLYNEVLSNSEDYPVGYMDYQMFEETYDRLKKESVIDNAFDIYSVFNIEFLENIYGRKFDS